MQMFDNVLDYPDDFGDDPDTAVDDEDAMPGDWDIGLKCAQCGTYFKDKHGFPVFCSDCFKPDVKNEYPLATQPVWDGR
jgi:hypothetical protein